MSNESQTFESLQVSATIDVAPTRTGKKGAQKQTEKHTLGLTFQLGDFSTFTRRSEIFNHFWSSGTSQKVPAIRSGKKGNFFGDVYDRGSRKQEGASGAIGGDINDLFRIIRGTRAQQLKARRAPTISDGRLLLLEDSKLFPSFILNENRPKSGTSTFQKPLVSAFHEREIPRTDD